jgi:phospho-N-acetylmuramoyl-pentapeptide-transferase
MSVSLLVGAIAFVMTLVIGRPIVVALRRQKLGKAISEFGPQSHQVKAGTPTMGGLMIYVTVVVLTLATNTLDRASMLLPLGVIVATGTLGMIDDFGSLQGRKAGGLSWRLKIGFLLVMSVVAGCILYWGLDVRSINVPWLGQYDIGIAYILVSVLVIVGTTTGVAITDGLDTLAGGTAAIAFSAYAVIAFLQGQTFLATFCYTTVGATLGFLWYNAHPAQVFMGDTGAMALGATLAIVALMTGQWLLVPVVGIVFVVEALSDVIQIVYFKLTHGKRIFRMTPIHHHFELLGWSEPQVVTRFWLLGIAGAMLGIALALQT